MFRLVALFVLIYSMPVLAHIPGTKPTDEAWKWADRQKNMQDSGCCGQGEALVLETDQVRIKDSDFDVFIDGNWFRISPWMRLERALEDPNPTGSAVVWYGPDTTMPHGVHVYCFAPPTMD